MPTQTVLDLLQGGADKQACFVAPETGRMLGYAQARALVGATADALRQQGVKPGDRVALSIPNGLETLIAFFGVLAAGAAAMPFNPEFTAEEMDYQLDFAKAQAFLVVAETAEHAARCRNTMATRLRFALDGDKVTLDGPRVRPVGEVRPGEASVQPDDDALLLYTSGTTSKPKGVVLKHRNLMASAAQVAETYRLTGDDRTICLLPLFHVHGLVASTFGTLARGGTLVVPAGKFSPRHFWEWAAGHQITWFTAVPAIHTILLGTERAAQPALRFTRSASSALAPETLAACEARYQAPMLEAYGMTEASHQIASNPLPPGERLPGSVGRPTGVRVTVLDDAGHELPPGAAGEVSLQGPNVTSGYLDNPEATAAAFTHGWFRTGDLGTIAANGYVTLLGRIKELINRGGEKISPREIDEALLRHPAVREAVAIGVPHPVLGEEVEAVVALKEGQQATETDLIAVCREHLAAFKCPKAIRFVPGIPRSATGKIQRRRLLELL